MCHFVSVVEKDGVLWYLTTKDIESRDGKALRDYCGREDDLRGHGAIRKFFSGLKGGKEREYKNFKNPDTFPPEIINDILKGKFARWFGPVPAGILKSGITRKYAAERKKLLREYADSYSKFYIEQAKEVAPVQKEYNDICAPLLKECRAKVDELRKNLRPSKQWAKADPTERARLVGELNQQINALWYEYEQKEKPYRKKRQQQTNPIYTKYDKKIKAVDAANRLALRQFDEKYWKMVIYNENLSPEWANIDLAALEIQLNGTTKPTKKSSKQAS